MADFPIQSRTPPRDEIVRLSDVVAAEYALPRALMLALCFAESGEGLQSFERWHRWTSEALEYIERRDKDGLQTILARCAAIPTNDISFGPCHQTWRWSPEFQMTGGQPYDLDAILRFRALYIENPGHALRVAAEQLRRHWTTHGPDQLEALCRYNKPAIAGKDNPNRPNYQRALIRAGTEPSPDGGGSPVGAIIYEDYRDPDPAGRFAAMPKGIVLHGSRSGAAGNPKDREYLGTARYEQSNPNGLGWHATIGEGKVAEHLTPREWGWHALQASKAYLGVELAQAVEGEPITDGQVAALADWIRTRVLPVWPDLPMHFPSHAEVDRDENKINRGKTDAFRLGDPRMDELRARLTAALRWEHHDVPDTTYTVGPGILAAMQARGSAPATDEMYTKRGDVDEWSEAYDRDGRRYIWLPSISRLFVYEPAA